MVRTARMALVVAVVFGLAVRLALAVGAAPARIGGDPKVYDEIAASIAGGHGFTRHLHAGRPGVPTALHPPAWPFVLAAGYALTGHGTALDQRPAWQFARTGPALAAAHRRWRAGRIVNALLGAAVVGLLGLLALELFSPAVAVAAAAIAAAATSLIVLGLTLLSEPLFIALELAALLAVARHRRSRGLAWAAAAGALAGLATLTRANGGVLLVPLALGVWAVRPRGSWRALAALACAFAVVLTPWTLRNVRVMRAPVPVATDLGQTLAGTYNSISARREFRWLGPRHLPAADRPAAQTPREAARSWALTRAGLRYIGAHPLALASATFWNTERMLELDRRARTILAREVASPRLAGLSVAGFALLAPLALLGAGTRAARRAPAFLWLAPLALWLSTAPFAVNFSRFRAPLDPFLILLAACAVASATRRLARRVQAPPYATTRSVAIPSRKPTPSM